MTAYFAVGTQFHLLEAYFLTKIRHANESNVLIVAAGHRSFGLDLFERHALEEVWDEVIDLHTCADEDLARLFTRCQAGDSYYLFSISAPYATTCKLFSQLPRGVRRILAYDGVLSYQVFRWSLFASAPQVDPEFMESIDEFLVLDKKIGVDPEWAERTTELPIGDWLAADANLELACRKLNSLFGYAYEETPVPSWILFDRYFSSSVGRERERWLQQCVLRALRGAEIAVKAHPSDDVAKYADAQAVLLPDPGVPWELQQLNRQLNGHLKNPAVYVTYTSSAVLHDAAFLGIENYTSIMMEHIVENYLGHLLIPVLAADVNSRIFRGFATAHPRVSVYEPTTFQELADLACDLNCSPRVNLEEFSATRWYQLLASDGYPAGTTDDMRLGLTAMSMAFPASREVRYSVEGGSSKQHWISRRLIGAVAPRFSQADTAHADFRVLCDAGADSGGQPYCFGYNTYFEYGFYRELLERLRGEREVYLFGDLSEVGNLISLLANHLPDAFSGVLQAEPGGHATRYPVVPLANFEAAPGRVVVACGGERERVALEQHGLTSGVDFYFGTLFTKYTAGEARSAARTVPEGPTR